MKKITGIIITALALSSCTKEINIDLNSTNPQIVIEGSITDQPGPYLVKITKTVNFSESNNYPPITGALVVISDNTSGVSDTLTETTPGLYQTNQIIGAQGHTYQLKVISEEKEYNAKSTMPIKVNLDTLLFNTISLPGASSSYSVVPVYSDPIKQGNNYRYFQSVNEKKDESYLISNDNVGNGIINQRPLFSQGVEINTGDTVTVSMRCIDLETYTYFYTLSQIAGSGTGGGTTPTNPPNNITGNYALGLFSAYTTQTRTQIVK
jgi:hypothetical protein